MRRNPARKPKHPFYSDAQKQKIFLDAIATRVPLYRFMQIEDAIKKGSFDFDGVRKEIVNAAARAIFENAWHMREEMRAEDYRTKHGYTARYNKKSIPDRTPPQAVKEAKQIVDGMEKINGMPIELLFFLAANQEGHRYTKEEPSPTLFGYYFAMQSMGHGVSWWDSYPMTDPEIQVPHHGDFYAGIY